MFHGCHLLSTHLFNDLTASMPMVLLTTVSRLMRHLQLPASIGEGEIITPTFQTSFTLSGLEFTVFWEQRSTPIPIQLSPNPLNPAEPLH